MIGRNKNVNMKDKEHVVKLPSLGRIGSGLFFGEFKSYCQHGIFVKGDKVVAVMEDGIFIK